MPSVDVVARLELRAEQFSSEIGKSFASLETRSQSAASQVRSSFLSSFADVQRVAKDALVLPRQEGGGLDLSREIAGLKEAAASADRHAIATRELAVAAEAAALSAGEERRALLLSADAASVASLEAEQSARGYRDQVAALELLQTELRRTGSSQVSVTDAQRKGIVVSGQMRAGAQQLSYQIGDVATQFASGTNPMIIFAQQGSQVVQAIALMQAEAKGFIAFMSGPWGAVLLGAVSIIGVLASKTGDSKDAANAAKAATEAYAESIKALEQIAGVTAHTEEQRTAAIRRTGQANLDAAKAALTRARAELALADAISAGIQTGEEGAFGAADAAARAEGKVGNQRKRVVQLQGLLDRAASEQTLARYEKLFPLTGRLAGGFDKIAEATSRSTTTASAETRARDANAGAIEKEAAALRSAYAARTSFDDQYGLGSRSIADTTSITANLDKINQAEAARRAASDAAEEAARATAEENIRDLADLYQSAFEGGTGSLWKSFKRQGEQVIAELAARYTLALLSGKSTGFGDILASAGGTGSPLDRLSGFTGLLGGGGKSAAASASGPYNEEGFGLGTVAAGAKAGGLLGKIGGAGGIGGSLASAAGPFALAVAGNQLLGSVLGFKGGPLGIFQGMFDKLIGGSKSGVASISSIDGTAALAGTSGKSQTAAAGLAGSIQDALKQVADQLDAKLGSFAVSIGIRDGDYRVDPTGAGNLKVKKGVIDFGDDQEAAVRYAISNALADGAIKGISDAEQRILASGQDLDAALQKVLSIRSITTELQQRTDPVGYAIDQVTKKFTDLVAILDESGASAEQRADAEKLYRLELQDAQKESSGAKEALQDFLDSFKVGSSSPFSLPDQEAAAKAALQPFLDKIGSGTGVDQDAYLKAAQSFLDIERQLYGSTDAYFQALDKVQAATNAAIATIDKTSPIRGTASDPFAEKTAANTQTGNEIAAETNQLLVEQNGLLRMMLSNTQGASGIAADTYGFFTGTGTG